MATLTKEQQQLLDDLDKEMAEKKAKLEAAKGGPFSPSVMNMDVVRIGRALGVLTPNGSPLFRPQILPAGFTKREGPKPLPDVSGVANLKRTAINKRRVIMGDLASPGTDLVAATLEDYMTAVEDDEKELCSELRTHLAGMVPFLQVLDLYDMCPTNITLLDLLILTGAFDSDLEQTLLAAAEIQQLDTPIPFDSNTYYKNLLTPALLAIGPQSAFFASVVRPQGYEFIGVEKHTGGCIIWTRGTKPKCWVVDPNFDTFLSETLKGIQDYFTRCNIRWPDDFTKAWMKTVLYEYCQITTGDGDAISRL